MRAHGSTLGLTLALLVLPAGFVSAQTDDRGPTPALPSEEAPPEATGQVPPPDMPIPTGVETIEVIGEAENAADIQDEAQAITAFSAQDLDRANIFNIDSLALGVPGLHVGQSGQEAIVTLRGIGTENASITGEPGVAFHVDGVNYSQPAAARLGFFDLETLDVKLGPQGLEGGKNSTSGTINVVTKKPTDEFEVKGDLTYGNYDRRRATGAVNVPFGELAAARVAMFYEEREGFLDNRNFSTSDDPFDVDDFGLRSHLLLTPTDSLQVLLSYNYYKQGGNGPQADLVPIHRDTIPCKPTGGVEFNAGPSVMPALARCNFEVVKPSYTYFDPQTRRPKTTPQVLAWQPAAEDGDPREVYADFQSSQSNHFWGWTSTVDWDAPELALIGATHLKLIGGFQDAEQSFAYDQDATNLVFSTLDTDREPRSPAVQLRAPVERDRRGALRVADRRNLHAGDRLALPAAAQDRAGLPEPGASSDQRDTLRHPDVPHPDRPGHREQELWGLAQWELQRERFSPTHAGRPLDQGQEALLPAA
jgi:outer membrane receptor protein involved in Fe transport